VFTGSFADAFLFMAFSYTNYSRAFCIFFTNNLMLPFMAQGENSLMRSQDGFMNINSRGNLSIHFQGGEGEMESHGRVQNLALHHGPQDLQWFFPGLKGVQCHAPCYQSLGAFQCDKAMTQSVGVVAWATGYIALPVEMVFDFQKIYTLSGWKEMCSSTWHQTGCLKDFKIQKSVSDLGPWEDVFAGTADAAVDMYVPGSTFSWEPTAARYWKLVVLSTHATTGYLVNIVNIEFQGAEDEVGFHGPQWFFPGSEGVQCEAPRYNAALGCEKAMTQSSGGAAWAIIRIPLPVEMIFDFQKIYTLSGWKEMCSSTWHQTGCLKDFKIQKSVSDLGPWEDVFAGTADAAVDMYVPGSTFSWEPTAARYWKLVVLSNHETPANSNLVNILNMEFQGGEGEVGKLQCSRTLSDECQALYDLAVLYGTKQLFYDYCQKENESDAEPLRTHCSLCCGAED